MSIGWVRLTRARRSQLFLRSALKRRKDEDLSHRWGVGPVASSIEGSTRGNGNGTEDKREGKDTTEDKMMKKDGTEL